MILTKINRNGDNNAPFTEDINPSEFNDPNDPMNVNDLSLTNEMIVKLKAKHIARLELNNIDLSIEIEDDKNDNDNKAVKLAETKKKVAAESHDVYQGIYIYYMCVFVCHVVFMISILCNEI